jgi:cation diffusion facilitator CzcD-associated flavoprotein CzcO
MERCDVAIIGAGPYGLAAAAHLRGISGLDVALFGEPMSFWEQHMPSGMCLRSPWDASHISDPEDRFSLDAYRGIHGRDSTTVPIRVNDFIKYGRWFLSQLGLSANTTKVMRIDRFGDGFRLGLENGSDRQATRVVIAAGVQPFAHRPELFEGLPSELVSHTSEHRDLSRFRGKDVFVVGAGTSALEAAMFLREAEANVEVLIRDSVLRWPRQWMHAKPLAWMFYGRGDVGPAIVSLIVQRPELFRKLPRWVQTWWGRRAIRPSVLPRLRPGVASVPIHTSRCIMRVGENGGRLRVQLNDGTTRVVDHIVLGTGYRVDVARYPFLPSMLLDGVARSGGFPILDGGFETSINGLHFVGAPAAWSFGPLMRFVAGTEFAARTLARRVATAPARDAAFDAIPAVS